MGNEIILRLFFIKLAQCKYYAPVVFRCCFTTLGYLGLKLGGKKWGFAQCSGQGAALMGVSAVHLPFLLQALDLYSFSLTL